MSQLKLVFDAIWKGKGAAGEAKKAVEGIGKSAKESGKNLNNFLSNTEAQFLAAAAAGAVLAEAIDMAEEGANILVTQERFDALTASIGSTADVMERLNEVTGGTIGELEAMNSANQLMAMGLVQSEDELLKLFDTVNKLKSPTDSLTDSMENFSLMLANQSIARLDSFGISSGAVKNRMAELMEATEGMTRETAFFIATMDEAENTMARTGTAAGVTANNFTRIKVAAGDNLNSLKTLMAEGLDPIAQILLGDFKDGFREATQAQIEAAEATGDQEQQLIALQEQLLKTKNLMGVLTGAHGENKDEVAKNLAAQLDYNETLAATRGTTKQARDAGRELERQLQAIYGETVKLTGDTIIFANGASVSARFVREYAKANAEAAAELHSVAQATRVGEIEAGRFAEVTRYQTQEVEKSRITLEDYIARSDEAAGSTQLLKERNDKLASSQAALAAETEKAGQAITETEEAVLSTNSAFQEANDLVERMIANESLLAQSDLSSEDRDAALQNQIDLVGELAQSYDDVFTSALLANQGITQSTLDTLVATGNMTEEEADRTLKIAETTTALEELATSTEFATLSTQNQAEAYQLVIDGQAATAEEAIALAEQFYFQEGATTAASLAAIDLKNNLLAIDGMNVTATVNFNTVGSIPVDPMSGQPMVPQDAIDSGDVTQRDGGVGLGVGGVQNSIGIGGQGSTTSTAPAGIVMHNTFIVPNAAMAQQIAAQVAKQVTPTG